MTIAVHLWQGPMRVVTVDGKIVTAPMPAWFAYLIAKMLRSDLEQGR